jgi:hypothetical protein
VWWPFFLCKQPSALEGALRPAEAPAKKWHPNYHAHARVLDGNTHRTASGVAGLIEARLLRSARVAVTMHKRSWVRWWAHSVNSPRLSTTSPTPLRVRGPRRARPILRSKKIKPSHKQPIERFWGLTAQRGWAHLILGHLDAPARGSVAPAHERGSGWRRGACFNVCVLLWA